MFKISDKQTRKSIFKIENFVNVNFFAPDDFTEYILKTDFHNKRRTLLKKSLLRYQSYLFTNELQSVHSGTVGSASCVPMLIVSSEQ